MPRLRANARFRANTQKEWSFSSSFSPFLSFPFSPFLPSFFLVSSFLPSRQGCCRSAVKGENPESHL